MTSDDEPVNRFLVGCAASRGAGPCPDASLVAGFAEGRLSEAEADLVLSHAAGCPECRTAIAELARLGAAGDAAGTAPPERPRPAGRLLAHPRAVAIAAAALVAIGVGALVVLRSQGPEASTDMDARLVAAARDLASAEPGLFSGFVPLSHSERVAAPDGRERGGLRLLGPTDVVLSGRPTFRWAPVPGAPRCVVTVARESGGTLWMRITAGAELPYPADAPGLEPGLRYAWTVETEAVLGGKTSARRTFAVASREEAEAFARAQRAIDGHVPADLSALLAAHWALRHGLLEEAERLARKHVVRNPDGAAGRETLRAILRRRGAPDGDDDAFPAGRPR